MPPVCSEARRLAPGARRTAGSWSAPRSLLPPPGPACPAPASPRSTSRPIAAPPPARGAGDEALLGSGPGPGALVTSRVGRGLVTHFRLRQPKEAYVQMATASAARPVLRAPSRRFAQPQEEEAPQVGAGAGRGSGGRAGAREPVQGGRDVACCVFQKDVSDPAAFPRLFPCSSHPARCAQDTRFCSPTRSSGYHSAWMEGSSLVADASRGLLVFLCCLCFVLGWFGFVSFVLYVLFLLYLSCPFLTVGFERRLHTFCLPLISA